MYNFQGIYTDCEVCDKRMKTSNWHIGNRNHLFCSQECYWKHRSEFYSEFYYDRVLNDTRKETRPERAVREWLDNKNIKYKQECGFLRKYFVDFYLPDYKIILEVFGDYWHVNPEIYDTHFNDDNKTPMNDYQKDLIDSQYDEKRKRELESYGYPVHILWEKDIVENLDEAIKEIKCLSETFKNS